MANTVQEVIEQIETVLNSFGDRQLRKLISVGDMSDRELFELRGKAQAAHEILMTLRSTIGYTVPE